MTGIKYFMGVDCSSKRIDYVLLDGKKNWVISGSLTSAMADMDERMYELYIGFIAHLTALFAKFKLSTSESRGVIMAAVENPIYIQNIKATVSIAQVVAVAKLALKDSGVITFGVDNRSWKKYVLGDGRADKIKIRQFAEALWGDKITCQDIADASAIALWCLQRGG